MKKDCIGSEERGIRTCVVPIKFIFVLRMVCFVYWHSNIECPYKLIQGPQFRLS